MCRLRLHHLESFYVIPVREEECQALELIYFIYESFIDTECITDLWLKQEKNKTLIKYLLTKLLLTLQSQ